MSSDEPEKSAEERSAEIEKALRGVRVLSNAELEVDYLLAVAVVEARQVGATWRKIAEAVGISLKNTHTRFRPAEVAVQAAGSLPRRTGHARARVPGGEKAAADPQPGIVESTLRDLLDALHEPYEEPLPIASDEMQLHLPRRKLTVVFNGVQITDVRLDK